MFGAHKKVKTTDKDETKEDHPFKEGKEHADIVLVVGDQRFHVNKSVLMIASPVFERMFSGKFKEKDAAEVKLKDDDPKEFLTFLKCLYPGINEQITAQNALAVVQVADKYQVEALVEKCDRILAAECTRQSSSYVQILSPPLIVTYVEAAEKYGLKNLLIVSTTRAVALKSEEIKKSKISKETQLEIFRRRVESLEKLISDLDGQYYTFGLSTDGVYNVYHRYITGETKYFN